MSESPHLDGPRHPPPGSPGSGLVAVPRSIVTWDADGNPVATTIPVLTKTQIVDIVAAAVSQPYSEPGDELAIELGLPPSEFYGKSNMEVMLVKLTRAAARSGDRDSINDLLDRLLGRPKQTSESHRITETYEEALQRIGRAAKPINAHIVEDAEL